ncbi:beta strand repeat-containing protein [Andreprevotia chitinilytica]|uniref:beta strand repeat-containing protein n=1 Tax=Andreprevotia chitinilytica TaxID=396808 RepID=UPI000B1299F1|nr:Ig-like domain-containing protein [Andreprevotia chitinilytica]
MNRIKQSGLLRGLGYLAALATCIILGACNGGASSGTASGVAVASGPVVSTISVLADKTSIKTGGVDFATLTVTALDANNGALANAVITVSASSGILGGSTLVTNSSGKATVTYNPGQDKSNRTQVITFTSGSATATSSVLVTGTTLTVTAQNGTSLASGASTGVDIVVTDGASNTVDGATVALSASGTGTASLSTASATTANGGKASVTVTGQGAGTVTLSAAALGSTRTLALTVTGNGNGLQITSPATTPTALTLNTPLTITVSAPPTTTSVTFVATVGKWSNNSTSIVVTPVGGVASASFQSSTAGQAAITVFDTNAPALSSKTNVILSSTADQATSVVIQALPAVVAPSSGSQTNTSTLTVSVTDSNGQGVAGAAVSFSMTGQPGGGENISPQVVVTGSNPLGQAVATFNAGSLSTTQGQPIKITATVLRPTAGALNSTPASIVIGGTAGSVAIGQSSTISATSDNTAYLLPMSVIVADSSGNPVANTQVSLSVWPVDFSIGSPCFTWMTFRNEDTNENLVADPGEISGPLQRVNDSLFTDTALLNNFNTDSTTVVTPISITKTAFTPTRTTLVPPNSAAGTVPATVTTDSSGRASFTYTYLKSNALWIVSRLRATALVQGTQTVAESVFRLAPAAIDTGTGTSCHLPASPYNAYITVQ